MPTPDALKLLQGMVFTEKLKQEPLKALMVELMASYISKKPSPLMESVLKDDMKEFCRLFEFMASEGKKIKSNLKKELI